MDADKKDVSAPEIQYQPPNKIALSESVSSFFSNERNRMVQIAVGTGDKGGGTPRQIYVKMYFWYTQTHTYIYM